MTNPTNPEVERIAEMCREAYFQASLPIDGVHLPLSDRWRAVARAVLEERDRYFETLLGSFNKIATFARDARHHSRVHRDQRDEARAALANLRDKESSSIVAEIKRRDAELLDIRHELEATADALDDQRQRRKSAESRVNALEQQLASAARESRENIIAILEGDTGPQLGDMATIRAVIALLRSTSDSGAHPSVPATDGPTLAEVVRERDNLRSLLEESKGIEADAVAGHAEMQARLDAADEALWRERDEAQRQLKSTEVALDDQRQRRKSAEARVNELEQQLASATRARDEAIADEYHTDTNCDRELAEAIRERDALRARLDAIAAREPTTAERCHLAEVVPWGNRVHIWRYVRDALLATAQEPSADQRTPAPVPTSEDLPAAPYCTRCMDQRVVQTGLPGSVDPCPACAPAPTLTRCASCRVVVGPPPGWHECRGAARAAKILRRAEFELATIANTAGRVIYPDEADALLVELARLRKLLYADHVPPQPTKDSR